jgi:hypothetical protein
MTATATSKKICVSLVITVPSRSGFEILRQPPRPHP